MHQARMALAARITIILTLVLATTSGQAQDAGKGVTHRLSFPELGMQYIHVESEFPAGGLELSLLMPIWSPGSYHVVNYDSNLDILGAEDATGTELAVAKVEKDRWLVQSAGADRVRVRYRVHAADLNVAESWADPGFVLVNPTSVLLYTQESRDQMHSVMIDAPPELGAVMTAMPGGNDGPWVASGYDELVDSPIVIAPAEPMRFEASGHPYALVNIGDDSLWDRATQVSDVEKVIGATNDLWGVVPLQREYWLFNLLVEHGGGLEHDHSTVMMSSRWQMRKREDYVKWLSLVAHEYFHVWNVRRMRPQGIAHYDFRKEQYTPSLWLAEGITSYYDDLLLSRAGVISPSEYLERLAINIHKLEMTPGRQNISLEQASRDAWTRLYQPDANAINSQISYYTKGAVLGLVLDMHIRRSSDQEFSLDDVMREMWTKWATQAYPHDAFPAAVEAIAGESARAWLEPLLTTPVELDVDHALAWLGLVVDRHPERTAAQLAGEPVAAGFGINWTENVDELVVAAVVHGYSAAQAGIIPGDEVLAVNNERIKRADWEDRKSRLRPGEEVEMLVARRGSLLRMPLTLMEARPASYEILAKSTGINSRQKKRMQDWLGQAVTSE